MRDRQPRSASTQPHIRDRRAAARFHPLLLLNHHHLSSALLQSCPTRSPLLALVFLEFKFHWDTTTLVQTLALVGPWRRFLCSLEAQHLAVAQSRRLISWPAQLLDDHTRLRRTCSLRY